MLLGKYVPIFNSLNDIKNHSEKFFAEKLRGCGRMDYSSCVKDGETLWNIVASI